MPILLSITTQTMNQWQTPMTSLLKAENLRLKNGKVSLGDRRESQLASLVVCSIAVV